MARKTEKALFDLAITGDEESFSVLYKQYTPVVLKIKNKYTLRMFDLDDWLQEGQIIFYKCLHKYNLKGKASLGTYFKVSFERHVFNLLRRQMAFKRRTEIDAVSLESCIEKSGDYEKFCMEEYASYEESIELRERLIGFITTLSKKEKEVLQEELGLIECKIDFENAAEKTSYFNARSRLRKKLKEYLRKEE